MKLSYDKLNEIAFKLIHSSNCKKLQAIGIIILTGTETHAKLLLEAFVDDIVDILL